MMKVTNGLLKVLCFSSYYWFSYLAVTIPLAGFGIFDIFKKMSVASQQAYIFA